jgi:hypothetical protein
VTNPGCRIDARRFTQPEACGCDGDAGLRIVDEQQAASGHFSTAGLVQYCARMERACGGSSRTSRRCRAERIRCRLAESDGRAPMRRPWRTAAIKLSMGAIRGGLLCRSRGVIGCPTALLIMPVLFGDKEAEEQGQVPYTVQYKRVRRHADAAGHEMLRAVTSNTAVRLAKWSHPILSSNVAFCLRHRRFDAALGRQSAKPRSPLPTATDRARPIALNWMRHCTPSSARPGWPCILTRSASTCLKSFPAPGQPPAGHSRLTPLR